MMLMRITATTINSTVILLQLQRLQTSVSLILLPFPPVKNNFLSSKPKTNTNTGGFLGIANNNMASIANKTTTTTTTTTTTMSSGTKKDEDQDDILSFSSIFCFETNKMSTDEIKKNVSTCTGKEQEQQETVLIILNYPIPESSPIFDRLWQTSSIRIAADGGANRLYDYSKDLIPDRIRGDLDSLDGHVRIYYEDQHNVTIEQDSCQDTNDLDKALQVCCYTDDNDHDNTNDDDVNTDSRRGRCVIVYGAFGGRFDQEMASFAALYKWSPKLNHQMYLYSDETCAFLIPANKRCEIRLPFYNNNDPTIHQNHNNFDNEDNDNNTKIVIGEGPTCGLIPLGCRCESIITTGLEWDLDGTTPLEFGGLVSSSNRIMKPRVELVSSQPIIFTAEVVVVSGK